MVLLTLMIHHYQVASYYSFVVTVCTHCYYTVVLPKPSIVDLSDQIKWHQKQLQAGIS